MSNDQAYLFDILHSAYLILEFMYKINYEAFLEDRMRQDAVVRRTEIIGEATKRLSKEFRDEHSEIPWKEMAGMRDKVIHRYDELDFEKIWKVVQIDIPILIPQIEPLIPPDDEA